MTRKEKMAAHLEMIIWADMPEGSRLNAGQIEVLMAEATDEQKGRAYQRALTTSPTLLADECV